MKLEAYWQNIVSLLGLLETFDHKRTVNVVLSSAIASDENLALAQRTVGSVPDMLGFKDSPVCHSNESESTEISLTLMVPSDPNSWHNCLWLLPDVPEVRQALDSTRPPFNSKVLLIPVLEPSTDLINVVEVFTLNEDLIIQPLEVAQNETLSVASIPRNRVDLRGIHFKVGSCQYYPYFTDQCSGHDVTVNGYCGFTIDFLNFLGQSMNFTYSTVLCPNDLFGVKENGTWNGVIEMLLNGDIDIIGSHMTMTPDRNRDLAFTMSGIIARYDFMIRRSGLTEKNGADALATQSWLAHGLVAVALALMTFVTYMYSMGSNQGFEASLMGPTFGQGVAAEHMPLSTKVTVLTTLFYMLFMITIFSGRLTSHLSVTKVEAINSFKHIVENGIQVVALRDTTAYTIMKSAANGSYMHWVWQNQISQDIDRFAPTTEEILWQTLVDLDNVAIVGYSGQITNLFRKYPEQACEYELNTGVFIRAMGTAFSPDFRYKPAFDNIVWRFREAGLFQRLERKWLAESQETICRTVEHSSSVPIERLGMVFLALFGTAILSIVILVAEIICSYRQKRALTANEI